MGPDDLAAYRAGAPRARAGRLSGAGRAHQPAAVLGGLLIAFALSLLDRAETADVAAVVAAMEEAQVARTEAFFHGLYEDGYARRFLSESRVEAAAERVAAAGGRPIRRRSRRATGSARPRTSPPSTREGRCAAVTCSNGTGSGVIVPGTGIHVNNMLGEEDLNPLGFHVNPPGRRVPSMMSPTVVLRDGELEAGLGSGGSNRIRSAVLQTIIRLIDDGMEAQAAVDAPRVHFEAGAVQAEPGSRRAWPRPARRARLPDRPLGGPQPVLRWRARSGPRPGHGRAPRRRRSPTRRGGGVCLVCAASSATR